MRSSKVRLRCFISAETLALEVAADILSRLMQATVLRGNASMLVSGGHSPSGLFEQLRGHALDWSRVWISLADERWVSPGDPASNERLVREKLLQRAAAAARFMALKNEAETPELGAVPAWENLAPMPRPFDVTVLGMGDDGHTASLIPGSPTLATALDRSLPAACIATISPIAPHARLSLNLSALLDSRRIFILLLGEEKLRTYAAACTAGPIEEMPVRAVLRQRSVPVEVVWAP